MDEIHSSTTPRIDVTLYLTTRMNSWTLHLPYSEHDIITGCAENERWAQRLVYEAFYTPMYSVCLRYASTSADAEDIIHDGFLKVFKHIQKYKPGTSLHGWIKRIMINTSIDYYRRKKRRRTEDIDTAYGISSRDIDAISRVSEKEILEAVQSLPPTYRMVFNLYVIEGFAHKEVAKILEINESTSRSNLVKARAKLRNILIHKKGYER